MTNDVSKPSLVSLDSPQSVFFPLDPSRQSENFVSQAHEEDRQVSARPDGYIPKNGIIVRYIYSPCERRSSPIFPHRPSSFLTFSILSRKIMMRMSDSSGERMIQQSGTIEARGIVVYL
jgi:hypothetical protein